MKELTRKYANAKVVLISVSADKDEKAWREFVASKKMDWPQYRDTNESVLRTFAVHSFPTYWLSMETASSSRGSQVWIPRKLWCTA